MTSRNHDCWPRALNRGYLGLIPSWIVHYGAPFLGTALGGQPPTTQPTGIWLRTVNKDHPLQVVFVDSPDQIKEPSTGRLFDHSPDPAHRRAQIERGAPPGAILHRVHDLCRPIKSDRQSRLYNRYCKQGDHDEDDDHHLIHHRSLSLQLFQLK